MASVQTVKLQKALSRCEGKAWKPPLVKDGLIMVQDRDAKHTFYIPIHRIVTIVNPDDGTESKGHALLTLESGSLVKLKSFDHEQLATILSVLSRRA